MISSDVLTAAEIPAEPRADRNALLGLGIAAVTSEATYFYLMRFDAIDGLGPVSRFVACLMALFAMYGLAFLLFRRIRLRTGTALAIVIAGAVLFRITLLPAGLPPHLTASDLLEQVREDLHGTAVRFDRYLLYDDDLWRYLWDGHVWASGVNPFQFAPADPRLNYLARPSAGGSIAADSPWQDIRDNINHARVRTIYPPVAQWIFRLSNAISPGSVIALKGILVCTDLLTMLLVYALLKKQGSNSAWFLLYAWNPLLIKVVAGSGHIDIAAGGLLALTAYFLRKRAYVPAVLAFSGAVLVKLGPIVLIPFLARRVGWRRILLLPIVIGAAYMPFMHAGWAVFSGLTKFAHEWDFNSAFFLVLRSLARPFFRDPAFVARVIGGFAILATVVWYWRRDDGQLQSFPKTAHVLGALILFSPIVMPWYLIWLVPLAVLSQQAIWLWFTAAVCMAFFVMVNGVLSPPVIGLEYGVFLAVVSVNWFSRRRQQLLHHLHPAELHGRLPDVVASAAQLSNRLTPIPPRRDQ